MRSVCAMLSLAGMIVFGLLTGASARNPDPEMSAYIENIASQYALADHYFAKGSPRRAIDVQKSLVIYIRAVSGLVQHAYTDSSPPQLLALALRIPDGSHVWHKLLFNTERWWYPPRPEAHERRHHRHRHSK